MAFNDIRNTNYLESKIKIFLENDYINVIGEENLKSVNLRDSINRLSDNISNYNYSYLKTYIDLRYREVHDTEYKIRLLSAWELLGNIEFTER